ncbi:hypothetical protein FOL47_009927, partial [Perkinsus chesapeaki]
VPLRHLRDLKDSFNKHGNEDAIKVDFILRQNSSIAEEGYRLDCDFPKVCYCDVSTSTGFIYAMGTLLQIVRGAPYVEEKIPKRFIIDDYPSFPHRGMLIDTGRHYLPMDILKKNLYVMAFNKMNVLHWHLTDDISFSLDLPQYTNLQKGNPSPFTYSKEEIIHFIKLANTLGIKVIPEIDVPAHTQSWIRGYPELQGDALYWMDPTSNFTKDFVVKVVTDVVNLFYGNKNSNEAYNGERVIHLGGDETWDAWNSTALREWTKIHGKFHNKTDLVDYWLKEVVGNISETTGAKVSIWNDFLNDNATELEVIDTWQIWLYDPEKTIELAESDRLPKSASIIFSDYSAFYLDQLERTWADFYNVTFRRDSKGVIKGGEACLWGEFVDVSVFMARAWPRASAVAERLWCDDPSICPFNHAWAVRRLSRFRCFMSNFVLGHTSPHETTPLGRFQDISAPARFYSFNLIKEQWWCPEWTSKESVTSHENGQKFDGVLDFLRLSEL